MNAIVMQWDSITRTRQPADAGSHKPNATAISRYCGSTTLAHRSAASLKQLRVSLGSVQLPRRPTYGPGTRPAHVARDTG
jgi:hypothetical protein